MKPYWDYQKNLSFRKDYGDSIFNIFLLEDLDLSECGCMARSFTATEMVLKEPDHTIYRKVLEQVKVCKLDK